MWKEPVRGSLPDPSFYALSGSEQIRAYLRNLVPRPPLSHLVGLRLTQMGSGSATGVMPASPWLQHAAGYLDVKMLIESLLDYAVVTGAPPASDVVTASLSFNQLRPSTLDGESFVGRARVVHSGQTFTLAEVLVEDALGRAVAHATSSHLIRPMDPPPPQPSGSLLPVEEPVYATPDPYLRPLPAEVHPVEFDLLAMDSLTLARRLVAEKLPLIPIHDRLGLRFVEAEPGRLSISMPATGWLCTRHRRVAAGPIACLAHFALSGAAQTLAPAGYLMGVVDQTISFLAPVSPDGGELLARGRAVHQVGESHVSAVEVTDAGGNLVATGSQTSVLTDWHRRATGRKPERVLATVLFTDIVGSTHIAEELGDAAWRERLAEHDAVVRRQLEVWKGREVKTTGDGFLATFDSPARAVQSARAIRDAVKRLGLELRIGIHTGECEVVGSDVAGIAVHVAARVQAAAEPGETLVSSTLRDLVSGSGLRFSDRGRHQLKGVEGDWQLFAVQE